jgi:hypothetical protein
MTEDKSRADAAGQDHQTPHRARIPGFNAETEVGLGDVIKRATSLVGVRPCTPCSKRAENLNRWLVFTGRR